MGLHRGTVGERETQKAQDKSRSLSFSSLGSRSIFVYWYVALDIKYMVEIRREADV